MINGIRISYVWIAKEYQIFGINDEKLIKLIDKKNNEDFEQVHLFHEEYYNGFIIKLREYSSEKSFYQGKLIFGIKNIEIISSTFPVEMKKCGEEIVDNKDQTFFFDDISIGKIIKHKEQQKYSKIQLIQNQILKSINDEKFLAKKLEIMEIKLNQTVIE